MITVFSSDVNLLIYSHSSEVEKRFSTNQLRKFIYGIVRCGEFGKAYILNFIVKTALKESLHILGSK